MNIFIGGLLPIRQQRFRQQYPDVNFTFASDQETRQRWITRAKRADAVIIDQARVTHTIVNALRAQDIPIQFADGNKAIGILIEGICNAATQGSERSGSGPAAKP